jgi:hypothetical protein
MLLSKPLTAGLVLIALSAVSQGRVIQPSKENGHYTPIRAETLASTGSDFCRFHPEWADCTGGLAFDVRDSYHSKRAPPKITRPGKGDEPSEQDGSGAQTGEGTQSGDGAQTGGDKKDGEDPDAPPPDAPPPATNPVDAPVTPGPPPVLPAFADIPADFSAPGRVPGTDVLPNEIPSFKGLSDSPEDAARVASFRRFLNFDIRSSNIIQPDSHFLLYIGDNAAFSRTTFRNEFDIERKHQENVLPNDLGRIIDNTDVYTGLKSGDDKVPTPPQPTLDITITDKDRDGIWLSMLESYGVSKRAAQRGGTVRVLIETKPAQVYGAKEFGLENTNAINKGKLFQEGSFFYNFELNVLTGPGTQVKSVYAYGATKVTVRVHDPLPDDEFHFKDESRWEFTKGEEIWNAERGDAPLGKEPNWIEGTLPEEERPLPEGDDDLIDLGFR